MIHLIAGIYLLGSALVGAMLFFDGSLLVRNDGVLHPDHGDKALRWTAWVIVIESGWIGVSVAALCYGWVGSIVPALYLIVIACVLVAGAVRWPMRVAVITKVGFCRCFYSA